MIPRARWPQIQSLFEQLADVNPTERSAFLNRVCGNDDELRLAVESLLDLDHTRKDPVLHVIGAAAESLLEDHRDRLIGTRVGAYRVVSILGHGGMSTVYRGERDDAQYRQTVAIKVLHHATLHPRLRSRLHSERHILATLDHPCIARLIDSGDLDDGTPYLVMEYVDGEAIDEYCDSRTLFIRERIELFVEVCAAVHYAHRNLVVHRDIKASNILVTDEGTAKLLDFGIAKLLAPESLSHTLAVTRLQERILTPENAAPEQVLGRPITTATDIYALGVLLYLLLTGRSPYRLLSYSQLQLERAICMDDPARPSQIVVAKIKGESDSDRSRISDRRGLSPQRLRARLAGDLDAIVAMAMRKEPERRYASVESLADDLRRHLLGQPVHARQGDWRYNSRKFLRRNLIGVIAVGAAFAGMLMIVAMTLWQNHRLSIARDATVQERDRSQQVSAFLVDVFSMADPYVAQGKKPTATDVLDSGAEKIANTNLQPEVRAELLESIGLAYRHLGEYERAIHLFEQALEIRRAESPPNDHNIAAALANLARALSDAGSLVSAEGYLQQALEVSQRGADPRSVETADIMLQFGYFALNGKSDPDRAKSLFSGALNLYQTLPGDQHPSIASALSGLAYVAMWNGDYLPAEAYQRDALKIIRETEGRNHPDHSVALAGLGYILTQRGKYAEAEQTLNEALDIERAVFGADNQRIATIKSDLGILFGLEGDTTRAIAMSEEAVNISRSGLGDVNYVTGYLLDGLASQQRKAGNIAAAETDARQALAIYAKTLPARHLYVASTRQLLGEIDLSRGLLAEAEMETRTALDIDMSVAGPQNWRTARAQAALGWILLNDGKEAEGESLLMSGRSRLLATLGAEHPETQLAESRLDGYLRKRHRDAEADQLKLQ